MKIDYKKLSKSKWYRQATDSVYYFTYSCALSVGKLLASDMNFILSMKADHARFYYNEPHFLKLANIELAKLRKDKNYLIKSYKVWEKSSRSILKKIEQVRKLNISKISEQNLITYNRDLGKLSSDFWLQPIFVDIFDSNADNIIAKELKKHKVSLTSQELSTLLSPDKRLISQDYQLALYKVLVGKDRDKQINSIISDYYYINCSYSRAEGITKADIKNELTNVSRKTVLKKEIIKLEDYSIELKDQKRKILRKYRIPKDLEILLTFFSDLAIWRDERKTVVQKTVFGLNLLGQEIARRSKLSWNELSYCLPEKITQIPVKKSTIELYLNLARDKYLFAWDSKKNQPFYFDRPTTSKLLDIIDKTNEEDEIRGSIANVGKVNGRINIIRGEQDFSKFKAGEILVTAMTRPEFLPLMRKAAAIVTDEGGVTCHAAIVSRELGKPCIIGTKIATKNFKTGDMVEVNANHGWVRKI